MQRLRLAIVAATLVTAALGAPVAEELAIGASGPSFNLKGTDGQMHSLDQVKGAKGTAVIFTCNECPYSKGYEQAKGIGFVAINANDPTIVPGDAYEFMITRAKDKGFPFPYLHDESQAIATAYGAKVTPHIYLLDASGWEHGVSREGVLTAARFISDAIGRPLATKVGQAGGWGPLAGSSPA